MKRFSVIIAVLLLLLICAGCVPQRQEAVQPEEVPENQRFYLNSSKGDAPKKGNFVGETSARNMELFSAVYQSLHANN